MQENILCMKLFFFTDGAAFWRFTPLAYSPKLRAIFQWRHLGGPRYPFRRSDFTESELSADVKVCRDLILPRVSKKNGYSGDLLHAT